MNFHTLWANELGTFFGYCELCVDYTESLRNVTKSHTNQEATCVHERGGKCLNGRVQCCDYEKFGCQAGFLANFENRVREDWLLLLNLFDQMKEMV